MVSSTVTSCAYCAESLARVCDWTEMQDGLESGARGGRGRTRLAILGQAGAGLVAEMDLDWS